MLLAKDGFELRQWISNIPEVISHLPKEVRSQNSELWLADPRALPQELALGLRWFCASDTLGYKYHLMAPSFLMALRRFIACKRQPAELLLDQSTNFKGGERKVHNWTTFKALHPALWPSWPSSRSASDLTPQARLILGAYGRGKLNPLKLPCMPGSRCRL